jgi:aminoglycoside phosphotransferase (APT) family kinase protein
VLIGKVYSAGGSRVFDVMDRLSRSGFDAMDELSIPRPLAFLEELGLLLYEKVKGPRAQEFFVAAGSRQRAAGAERCARWLARFHALAPRTAPVFGLPDHMARMAEHLCFIAGRNAGLGAKASRLLDRVQTRAPAFESDEMCGVHGDYVLRNVLLSEGRTVVYDWDWFSLSDPARDVASFSVAFQRLALSRLGAITALDSEAEVFEKTYLAAGRQVAAARLRFFKASMCLQFAKNILSNQKRHWSEHAEAMLDQGFRFLEPGQNVLRHPMANP